MKVIFFLCGFIWATGYMIFNKLFRSDIENEIKQANKDIKINRFK